ncbi:MAG: hypothetical protein AB7T06_26780 [Kofleriaceae bacterium]
MSDLPAAAMVDKNQLWRDRLLYALPWVIVVLPALYQLFLLSTAITGRLSYPYDLEWMEGGILHHAMRIHDGQGIYVAPSIDFIPYLYTPLYPSLLALFSGVFGISYVVGRVVSILSLIGIAASAFFHLGSRRHEHARMGPAIAGALFGLALFAAAYPYMEGWYDLVRADTFFLYIVTAALAGLPRWSTVGTGVRGHARVAAGAAMLALAFFTKQTGIIYVALGGMIVLVLAWRRVATYVAVAGAIGLGGTALLQKTTDGWFWIYIREIHAAHDFNMDRFWKSFGYILWHFPAASVVIALTILVVAITRIAKGPLPRGTHPFLLWTPVYAVSTLVGAVGWGTEFAHFNAYMPAFLHGGLAAGAALPALFACARLWFAPRPRVDIFASAIALAAAIPLALACYTNRWEPRRFIPTAKDRAAGDKLIARIHAIDGEVWMPSHPWYLHLAGKSPRVHRMGIKDVTARKPRPVLHLDEAIDKQWFSAIVLDDRDVHLELGALALRYRAAVKLPANERPRLYTGAKIVPDSIWLPIRKAVVPAGAKVLFDFETVTWDGWTVQGGAFGPRPASEAQPGQGLVVGTSGLRFANSAYDGDKSIGRAASPPFDLTGTVTLKLGGGTDASKLRVELWDDRRIVAVASVPPPGGDTVVTVELDPGALPADATTKGQIVLVDDSPTGHIVVDDVWITPRR